MFITFVEEKGPVLPFKNHCDRLRIMKRRSVEDLYGKHRDSTKAQVILARPMTCQLFKNICRMEEKFCWELHQVDSELAGFQEDHTRRMKRTDCLQNAGGIFHGPSLDRGQSWTRI